MSKMKKVIVTVSNDLYTDQRVHKVCTFIHKQGYDVLLVGREKKDSVKLQDRLYKTKRLKLIWEKGPLFYAELNIRLFFYLFFKPSAIIVSNDLDTLLACFIVKKFKANNKLIYDSHEYFTEVPELVARPSVQKIWEGIEKWIFPKLNDVYTVNSSIANLYTEKYKKPISVVRNISPLFNQKPLKTKKELGIPEDKFILIMQGAGINIDRGAEEAVAAMITIEGAVLLIIGDGDVLPILQKFVTDNKLEEKVKFFPKMPYNDMMNYTIHADLGLTLDKPTNINYRFSLPNKIFDYIHTSTPVLGSNLIEIRNIIQSNNIGKIIDEVKPEIISKTINEIISDKESLMKWKANCNEAKKILNWENESKQLKQFYPKVD